ncbi:hypothetical protein [Acidithiobacillus sp. AMEEHan]|uniref:hypothetical protein n=1 Tax=Acidithiobacillus sp. AMEEHan TaxID=2994951 RepID=UPI0027E57337|nr:hypothetical protein [Acidithiobacillus sp. AMEEHan]
MGAGTYSKTSRSILVSIALAFVGCIACASAANAEAFVGTWYGTAATNWTMPAGKGQYAYDYAPQDPWRAYRKEAKWKRHWEKRQRKEDRRYWKARRKYDRRMYTAERQYDRSVYGQ